MRKKLILVFSIILIIFSIAFFTACTVTDVETAPRIKSVSVHSKHEGDYIVGEEVDLSELSLQVLYSDGKSEEVAVSEYMLDEVNRAKFFTPGVQTVVFNYGGFETILQISVKSPAEEVFYLATFFSNGGSTVENQKTKVITAFDNPTRENYTFDGWYTNPDFSGNKAVRPYTLTGDTIFYAKWVDNRRCNIKFYDGDEVVYDFDVVYGTGIDIKDLEKYPAPQEKVGKIFMGWALDSGSNLNEIIVDTRIKASYESVKCIVNVEFFDGDKVTTNPYTYDYGEVFFLDPSRYVMPTLEGYTSRWVLYRNDSADFEEVEDDLKIPVTDTKITIRPYHVINVYTIVLFNGMVESEQTKENLKVGTVALEQVYANAGLKSGFKVEYNTDFYLSGFTQEPYLVTPEQIYGYDTYWCFVVTDSHGEEIWYNNNRVWSDTEKDFVGEFTTNYVLRDKNDNYIARVENGDLKEIRGDVLIKPKYIKKKYTVTLMRRQTSGWEPIIDPVTGRYITFEKEYLSDFGLYNPEEYEEGRFASPDELEFFYHKNNVPRWTFDSDVSNLWKTIYFNGNSSDDFAVKWYSSVDRNESSYVDFVGTGDSFGIYEITKDLELFCDDIDLRRYTVTIRYGYNFDTDDYKYSYSYDEITESTEIEMPLGYGASITRDFGDGRTVQYTFEGWYDYPYVPDDYSYPYNTTTYGYPYGTHGTYNGNKSDDFITGRTNNVYYYAHYKCDAVYTFTVFDKTQQTAYDDIKGYDGAYYNVPENSIVYTVPAGTTITPDMLFKGRDNGDGTMTMGQVYFERYFFMNYFVTKLTPAYNALLAEYDSSSDFVTARDNLLAELNAKSDKATAYRNLLGRIYNYAYEGMTKEYFLSTYMSVGEYQALCKEIHILEGKLDILDSFSSYSELYDKYFADDSAEVLNGGLYKRYDNSIFTLNMAYGYDIVENPTEYKYKFAGWYSDSTYSTLFSSEFDFGSWFAWNEDITLYAKWADEEKGTEGLVFRKVLDADGNEALVVVDFMNRAQYEASDIYGCGFNEFEQNNTEYSINLSDQGGVPVTLGEDIDLQIPATHGGTNDNPLPVIGILANAFIRHGRFIKTISLPNNIKFVEEDAFASCILVSIFYNGTDDAELFAHDEKALYQNMDYVYTVGGVQKTAQKNVLIVFASRDRTTTSYTVRENTVAIGSNAFNLAGSLLEVVLNDGLVRIGAGAFANSGLSNTLVLPDSLTTVENNAFANCANIKEIIKGDASQLTNVGKYAFNDTGWFIKHIGIVTLNNIVLGIRDADMSIFDKDENGKTIVRVVDGADVYSYTNEYGVMYYGKNDLVLVRIDVNSTATQIAPSAFEGLSFSKVVINGTLADGIGSGAFSYCNRLQTLVLADVDGQCKVALDAFNYCSNINAYVTDKSILDSSWSNCNNITLQNI